jgi:hypothetical protein
VKMRGDLILRGRLRRAAASPGAHCWGSGGMDGQGPIRSRDHQTGFRNGASPRGQWVGSLG